nr:hypothetical protein Iba_chr12bCG9930 [Ipomoea batatas]
MTYDDSRHDLLPKIRLSLLNGSHHHITHASRRQTVEAALDALDGDDVEIDGFAIPGYIISLGQILATVLSSVENCHRATDIPASTIALASRSPPVQQASRTAISGSWPTVKTSWRWLLTTIAASSKFVISSFPVWLAPPKARLFQVSKDGGQELSSRIAFVPSNFDGLDPNPGNPTVVSLGSFSTECDELVLSPRENSSHPIIAPRIQFSVDFGATFSPPAAARGNSTTKSVFFLLILLLLTCLEPNLSDKIPISGDKLHEATLDARAFKCSKQLKKYLCSKLIICFASLLSKPCELSRNRL